MVKRNCEKYIVKKAMTERYRKSALLSMQRLLNQSEKAKNGEVLIKKSNFETNNDLNFRY